MLQDVPEKPSSPSSQYPPKHWPPLLFEVLGSLQVVLNFTSAEAHVPAWVAASQLLSEKLML